MHPTVKAARTVGFVYLAMILVAPFSMLYVPGKLIVRDNAAATAEKTEFAQLMVADGGAQVGAESGAQFLETLPGAFTRGIIA